MACPLFVPSVPLGELVSIAPPLGDLYGGHCAADPDPAVNSETLRRYCNFGYARGHCERAGGSDADAVRLLVRQANGNLVQISWAIERNHHPVAVGSLEIDTSLCAPPAVDPLARQAYACATAYARQTAGNSLYSGRIAAAAHP